jgi:hypothetical protein
VKSGFSPQEGKHHHTEKLSQRGETVSHIRKEIGREWLYGMFTTLIYWTTYGRDTWRSPPPPEEEAFVMYYLPHHAVVKEKRGDAKWRIVFDGPSHEDHAPSLNDPLEMGLNLLPKILATLLRFRLYPVGIIGDISQAFLQLSLDRNDRDLTRFLCYRVTADDEGNYDTTGDVMTCRFTRLPFGLTCSPCLLSATIRELADYHCGKPCR